VATTDQTTNNDRGRKTLLGIVAVLAILLVAGLVIWLVLDHTGSSSSSATTTQLTSKVGPVVASGAVLSALAANAKHDVYWAGTIAGNRTEFQKVSNGSVYVRYLPQGVTAGDPRGKWLVIATYPFANGYQALKKVGQGKTVAIPGGGIALVDSAHPQSVHFAFPGVDLQGEVYDPSPAKALAVATSGKVTKVP